MVFYVLFVVFQIGLTAVYNTKMFKPIYKNMLNIYEVKLLL